MIARGLTLLLLLALLAGGVWYVFRETPETQVERWRELSTRLFAAGDIRGAEEFNERVLELMPQSVRDRLFRARLAEARSTQAGLREALRIYTTVVEHTGPRALALHLERARVARRLGRLEEARGMARSVVDAFPFEATLELGHIALEGLSPREALAHFHRAHRQFAGDDAERRARALSSIAAAHGQILLLERESAPLSAGDRPAAPGQGAEEPLPREAAFHRALDEARDLVSTLLRRTRSLDRYAPWLAALCVQQSRVPHGEARPLTDGGRLLHDLLQRPAPGDVAPELWLHAGTLLLRAEWFETSTATETPKAKEAGEGIADPPDDAGTAGSGAETTGALDVRAADRRAADADRDSGDAGSGGGLPGEHPSGMPPEALECLQAALLHHDPDAARDNLLPWLVPPDPAPGEAQEGEDGRRLVDPRMERTRAYVTNLLGTARLFLESPEYRRILEDPSELRLARRIDDLRRVEDAEVAGLFSVVVGLARLRAGDTEAAREVFDRWIASGPVVPGRAAIELAEEVQRLLPASPLVFELLDRADEASEDPLAWLLRRTRVLLRARSAPHGEARAEERLTALLDAASEGAGTPAEAVFVGELRAGIQGLDTATAWLRRATARWPREASVRRMLAGYLEERGDELAEAGDATGARAHWTESLEAWLGLLVEHPIADTRVAESSARLLRRIERAGDGEPPELAELLAAHFPGAPRAPLRGLARGLRAWLLGQPARAVELSRIRPAEPFRPFVSWFEGIVRLDLAARLEAEAEEKAEKASEGVGERTARLREEARARFARDADHPACRVELARLRLRKLPGDADVPEELMDELEALAVQPAVGFRGHWLLAQAWGHRYNVLARDPANASVLGGVIARIREALRGTIERRPDLVAAHVQLAESWLLTPPVGTEEDGSPRFREPLPRDYERAVNTLLAVPHPDAGVVRRIADWLEYAGRRREARPYLLAIGLLEPNRGLYRRVVESYIDSEEYDPARFLLDDDALPARELNEEQRTFHRELEKLLGSGAADRLPSLVLFLTQNLIHAEGNRRLHPAVWLALRERAARLPHWEGLRHELLGGLWAKRLKEAAPPEREEVLERVVDHYRRAAEHWADAGRDAPLAVLNNLAWYLATAERKERWPAALRWARRAAERVPEPRRAPDVHDTLGWALYRNGRLDEAREVFDRLLQVEVRPGWSYRRALVLRDLGDLEGSLLEIERALSGPRDFPEEDAALELRRRLREAYREASFQRSSPPEPARPGTAEDAGREDGTAPEDGSARAGELRRHPNRPGARGRTGTVTRGVSASGRRFVRTRRRPHRRRSRWG